MVLAESGVNGVREVGGAMAELRTGDALLTALARVAPGTELREGLEHVLSARTGALIVIGDDDNVRRLCNGGFDIDIPFSPQRLFELAKMDGAIILDGECKRIRKANVHLVPDPGLPTSETGMRHRTAERVSRETEALVISISQRRDLVTLYMAGGRVILDDLDVVLAKANQALQTLQRYRFRLDEVLSRLAALEFADMTTLGDLAEAISRFEMVRRVAREVERYILELGTEGRLIRMQADELTVNVDEEYQLVVRDYAGDPSPRKAANLRVALDKLTLDQLLEPTRIATLLGLPVEVQSAEDRVAPRGYRVLRKIPLLPGAVVNRLVERFGTLAELMQADVADLDAVDGIGTRRAAAIADGLARIRSTSAV